MSETTTIEWSDSTWNPIRGQNARHTCARISPGCDNCYAATMTRRGLMGTAPIDYGVGEKPNDPARLDEAALMLPHRWKKPRKVFVCSMTDLFGAWVPADWIARIISVMAQTPRHTYQVLTKRPSRARDMLSTLAHNVEVAHLPKFWPLPNVWVGVSIESDNYVWRANVLRQTPAAVRWISAEPLLGPLDTLNLAGIDWVVTGGESGPGARPLHPEWVQDIRDRCLENGTAYFHKQWGEFCHPAQMPEDTKGSGSFLDDLVRVGRKNAGRLLDGRIWSQFPGATP
jgi:protein gp37